MKRIIFVFVIQLAIYFLLFVVAPVVSNMPPQDTSANGLTILLVSSVISFAGVVFLVDEVKYWAAGLPLLWILIMIYHPQNIYGIGYQSSFGLTFSFPISLTVLGIVIEVFVIQAVLSLTKRLVQTVIVHSK